MQPFPLPASPHFFSPCSGSPADPQRARSWWEPGAALRSGIPWCLEHTSPVTPETPVWQGSWGSSEFGPGFLLLSLDPSSRVISSVPMDLNILKLMTSKFVSVAMTSPMNFDPRIRRPLDISLWGLPDMSNRSWPRWTSGFSPQFFHSHPTSFSPSQQTPLAPSEASTPPRASPLSWSVLLSEIHPQTLSIPSLQTLCVLPFTPPWSRERPGHTAQ